MRKEPVTSEWVLDRFDDIYPAYRTALARLLVTLRDDFDGDLDAMLVLLVLSLGTERTDWQGVLLGEMVRSGTTRVTNTLSIAEATGIPRETVRRKLGAMEAKGWIARDDKGNWTPMPRAAQDLRRGSQETIAFIRALVGAALAARPGRRPEVPSSDG